jgi:hypothetical protein
VTGSASVIPYGVCRGVRQHGAQRVQQRRGHRRTRGDDPADPGQGAALTGVEPGGGGDDVAERGGGGEDDRRVDGGDGAGQRRSGEAPGFRTPGTADGIPSAGRTGRTAGRRRRAGRPR